jgi:hypothetical protein
MNKLEHWGKPFDVSGFLGQSMFPRQIEPVSNFSEPFVSFEDVGVDLKTVSNFKHN